MRYKFILILFTGLIWAGVLHADMPGAIAKVKPSVVIVGVYKNTNSPRFGLKGSGFVVGKENQGHANLVITNAHVLQSLADEDPGAMLAIQVRGEQNEWQIRQAEVIEVDKVHDLALLRFGGPAVSALMVRDSRAIQEGQAVAFMGFPIGGALGFSPVTHRGMISSISAVALPTATAHQLNEKAILSLRGANTFNIFQLDGTAYPGNSGGPVFDPDSGDVLGVVNMVFVKGTRESALTNPSGISYAIPSLFVLRLLERSKAN